MGPSVAPDTPVSPLVDGAAVEVEGATVEVEGAAVEVEGAAVEVEGAAVESEGPDAFSPTIVEAVVPD